MALQVIGGRSHQAQELTVEHTVKAASASGLASRELQRVVCAGGQLTPDHRVTAEAQCCRRRSDGFEMVLWPL